MDAEESALRRQVRQFLTEQRDAGVYRPTCDAWMSSFSAEFSKALADRGWIGMTWPRRYGGAERSERERLVVIEELLAAGAPVAAHWIADRQTGPSLLRHGSAEQCARYLPAFARGECFSVIGMSEPESGSDLASVRTSASRTESGWRVNGRKVWTSHAHRAHVMLALVRTAPRDMQARHEGLSQFLIDLDTPGVQVRPIRSLDGQQHFNEVVFDDVELPESALLGEEGAGWRQVTAELANERSGPERFLSTAPLLFAVVRRWKSEMDGAELGRLLAELQALRTLSGQVAEALQRGESPATEAALVKDLGTRFESEVIELARRQFSVEPDLDSPDELARLLAEAVLHSPAGTLRGGTNEILRGIVARELVRS